MQARLTVSLDGRVFQSLTALAEAEDVSVAWLVRRAIHELIERRNQQDQGEPPLLRRNIPQQEIE